MVETILPSFLRYPKHGAIIGRLVAGYGELEFSLALCLGAVIGNNDAAIKALFRAHGEDNRIIVADALMRPTFITLGLKATYSEAIGDMNFCRKIRNRYAHCHWQDEPGEGLYFLQLEPTARKPNVTLSQKQHLTLGLLKKQEAYFMFAARCLWHLADEANAAAGRKPIRVRALPKKVDQPPPHSPKR